MVEAENSAKDIVREPQWSMLTDGLGYNVLWGGGITTINKDGEEIVEAIIKVDDTIKKVYNWNREKELDEHDNMKWTAKKIDLIPLNIYDDANRRWLYVKTLLHDPTDLS